MFTICCGDRISPLFRLFYSPPTPDPTPHVSTNVMLVEAIREGLGADPIIVAPGGVRAPAMIALSNNATQPTPTTEQSPVNDVYLEAFLSGEVASRYMNDSIDEAGRHISIFFSKNVQSHVFIQMPAHYSATPGMSNFDLPFRVFLQEVHLY